MHPAATRFRAFTALRDFRHDALACSRKRTRRRKQFAIDLSHFYAHRHLLAVLRSVPGISQVMAVANELHDVVDDR